jgi:predicted amidohydrolase YtcJ
VVLVHGKIWTGEPYLPPGRKAVASKFASGAAILHGRFVAVGSDDDVRPLIGPHTQVIDLHGKMAMPGFNDAHVHFMQGANSLAQVELKDAKSEAELVARIKAKAMTLKPGEWILGGSWDETDWPGKHLPTHALIDAVTKDNPLFVIRFDGHEALVNQQVLKMLKLTKDTPDPEGGVIVRDPKTGEATGVLKDAAENTVRPFIAAPSEESFETAFHKGLEEARRYGVTSMQSMNYGREAPSHTIADEIRYLHKGEQEGWLTARFYEIVPIENRQVLIDAGTSHAFGSDMVRMGNLKAYADGSIGSRSAWMFEDYDDQSGYRGVARPIMLPRSRMVAAGKEAIAAGLQISTHATGDRGNAETIDAYEEIGGVHTPDYRFRIEHLQHVRPEDFARLAKLGIIASMQPYHAIDDGRFVDDRIGRKRSSTSYAWRSVLDAGAPLAFGTDWPIAPLNPLLGVYAAVTRETTDGKNPQGWIPEQKITLEESLRAYTQGSAYAEFQERDKGTIAPGKLADIIVLSDDLFSISKEKIKDVTVLRTILGGRTVYQAQ